MIWREGKRERVIEGGRKEGLRARRKKAEKVGKEEGEEERKEEGKKGRSGFEESGGFWSAPKQRWGWVGYVMIGV